MVGGLDLAAELSGHRLLTVADAQHRDAELEQDIGGARRRRLGHRGRPAGQDHRAGCEVADRVGRFAIGADLAIDAAFAHPARDKLGHLRAEIEDQNAVGHGGAT